MSFHNDEEFRESLPLWYFDKVVYKQQLVVHFSIVNRSFKRCKIFGIQIIPEEEIKSRYKYFNNIGEREDIYFQFRGIEIIFGVILFF